MPAFPEIETIRFEGSDTDHPLAFRHYDETEVIEARLSTSTVAPRPNFKNDSRNGLLLRQSTKDCMLMTLPLPAPSESKADICTDPCVMFVSNGISM